MYDNIRGIGTRLKVTFNINSTFKYQLHQTLCILSHNKTIINIIQKLSKSQYTKTKLGFCNAIQCSLDISNTERALPISVGWGLVYCSLPQTFHFLRHFEQKTFFGSQPLRGIFPKNEVIAAN